MTSGFLANARRQFHADLFANKILTIDDAGVASNADRASRISRDIARGIIGRIGTEISGVKLAGQTAGSTFEAACAEFVDTSFRKLGHLRPGDWVVSKGKVAISKFDQYSHLAALAALAHQSLELAAALGSDYLIKPDITIGRHPEADSRFDADEATQYLDESVGNHTPLRKQNSQDLILHASISCKWTIRSDRSQNARSEGLNLVRNRKGRLPHIVVIVGEPLPARIASIALGTGDIDCVYHFALPELIDTVNASGMSDAAESLRIMIEGKRLRDISDLPIDLIV